MPYLGVTTNQAVEASRQGEVVAALSREVAAMLGKPESYVMVSLQAGVPMSFAASDAPAAYLVCKSIGLPEARTAEFSAALCQAAERLLQVPPARIYIDFQDVSRHLWGWDGRTF